MSESAESDAAYWSQECGYRTDRVTCLVKRDDHGNVGHEFVEPDGTAEKDVPTWGHFCYNQTPTTLPASTPRCPECGALDLSRARVLPPSEHPPT